jgi:hypothetical protein
MLQLCSSTTLTRAQPAPLRHARRLRSACTRIATVANTSSTAQVLKALQNPSGADVSKHLRHAAVHVQVGRDTTAWLESALVPRVLAILRSLPSGRPPKQAVEVCAAATAVLNNILAGLQTSPQVSHFRQLLAADQAACAALVHWGMARPEASERLPPALHSKLCYDANIVPQLASVLHDHPFWTPLTVCCSFLVAMERDVVPLVHYNPQLASWDVQEAASPGVVERLLRVAVRQPCGEPLPCHSRAAALRQSLVQAWLCVAASGSARCELRRALCSSVEGITPCVACPPGYQA